jgi:DNA-directed RNA polymerase specialized sigma24 family protein
MKEWEGLINGWVPRKRKSNKQRALGMLLYYAGLSYEKVGMFVGASYEAVREGIRRERNCSRHQQR